MKQTERRRTFPYAYARVSAMRSKLLKIEDYQKLLKMDLVSVTRFLQERVCKEPMTRLSAKFSGLLLIDKALRESQAETYRKLRSFCPANVVSVIDLYLERFDYQCLKVVLRGIYSNTPKEEVMSLIEPLGRLETGFFESLFTLGSVEKAVQKSGLAEHRELAGALADYRQNRRLVELENALDRAYYRKAVTGARNLGPYEAEFSDFLLSDIDIINIKNLVRYKKEGLPVHTIREHLIVEGLRLKRTLLYKLAAKESLQKLQAALGKTYYGKYVDFDTEPGQIELDLQKFHMKHSLLKSRQKPLSIGTILGYMLAKLLEVRNLRSLAKSKQLGLPMDYVEKNLLVAA